MNQAARNQAARGTDAHDARSSAPSLPARPPIHSLTGLRFVAALLVLLSHFPELVPVTGAHVSLVRQGAAGVTIFFVLSGTVLTYNYLDRFRSSVAGARHFIGMRLARIAPMNTVALITVTAVILILDDGTPSPLSWVLNLAMLQSLVPAQSMHLWNIPAWSISCELCFYVLLPLFVRFVLVRCMRLRSLAALAATLFVVQIAAFVAVALVVERHKLGSGGSSDDVITMLERIKFFPGLRVFEFFLGCVIGASIAPNGSLARSSTFQSSRRARDRMLVTGIAVLVVVFLIPVLTTDPTGGLSASLLAPGLYLAYTPAAVLLVAALSWGPTMFSPLLEHRSTRMLADATLSFYLLQWPVVRIVTSAGWAPERNGWFSGGAVVVLLAVSLLTARWIERPAQDWWRQRFRLRTGGG